MADYVTLSDRPVISIVIPAFNRAGLLPKAIESVQLQTYHQWECIVVDDFSTDNTRQVVEALAVNEKRLRYIVNQRSKGAQGSRNTGIINASGEWIAFLDSDDEWVKEKLEDQMLIVASRNYKPFIFVHGNCILKDHKNKSEKIWDLPLVQGETPFKTLLKGPSPAFPSILTSKLALDQVGLLDESVPSYQEWDASLSLSRTCDFVHMSQPLFIYNLHEGETISKNMSRDIEGYDYILRKYRLNIIEAYGLIHFRSTLLENIQRTIDLNKWDFGFKLLALSKNALSLKSYIFYRCCFYFRIHPDKVRDQFKFKRTNQW